MHNIAYGVLLQCIPMGVQGGYLVYMVYTAVVYWYDIYTSNVVREIGSHTQYHISYLISDLGHNTRPHLGMRSA